MQNVTYRRPPLLLWAIVLAAGPLGWGIRVEAQDLREVEVREGLCPPEVKWTVRPYVCPSKYPLPTLYAMADGLFLMRDPHGSRAMAALKTIEIPEEVGGTPIVTRTVVLGTQDFDADLQEGGRLLVGLRLGEDFGLETVFFGAYDYRDSATVTDDTETGEGLPEGDPPTIGSLASPFTHFGDPDQIEGLDFNNYASISEFSTFWNIEWNFRHSLQMPPGPLQASVLLGGRYAKITEQFDYLTRSVRPDPLGTVNQVQTRTENDLIGAQLGALIEYRLRQNCWMDFEIKGGIFKNYADQDTVYDRTDENGVLHHFVTGAENDVAAVLGDLSLSFVYQFSQRVTFRTGYNVIWIDGLALGYQNFNADAGVLEQGPGVLAHRGKVAYHGPHVGLIVTW